MVYKKIRRKKLILILAGMLLLVLASPYIIIAIKGKINKDILSNLQGEIYYTKRDDCKYLVYGSKEHLTPLGSLVHHLISDFTSNVYIMDLATGESSSYVDAYTIQWLMD